MPVLTCILCLRVFQHEHHFMNHARTKCDEILPSNNDVLRRSFLSKYAQYDGNTWEIIYWTHAPDRYPFLSRREGGVCHLRNFPK